MQREGETVGTRTCPTCGETKHVLAFAVDRKMKKGLYYRCRDCESKYQKEWKGRAKLALLKKNGNQIGLRGLSTGFEEKWGS